MSKKNLIRIAAALLAAIVLWALWGRLAAPTRIALVEFQPFQAASIVKANDDVFIKYKEVAADDFAKLGRYDMVLGFGMGMRITADQRAQIQRAADRGTPVHVFGATNPENAISNLDSVTLAKLNEYLGSGNKHNYRNLARYIRKEVDGKKLFAEAPIPAIESASNVLYHLDENVWFNDVEAYDKYLREKGFYTEGGAKVAVVGGLNDPFSGNRENIDSMIVSFQRAGMNIYPVASAMRRLDFLKAISPDAVVYLPHGRVGQGDAAVEWLKERNIPIFAPLSILRSREEWEADPQGMMGGFMSQSVVMPELDGAIYPFVVNAQEQDKDGVYLFKAIPERLAKFTAIVDNFVGLKHKPNSEKRLSIYFFKGAGQSTLAAQGLETIPALYNLLKRLCAEGYNVDGLPSTEAEFSKMIMTQGEVLSTYAEGAFDNFLRRGNPALVEKEQYESWAAQAMPTNTYADVVDIYGQAPGSYMAVDKDGKQYLAVARIQLGNVALLPQPMAALGDDEFAIVHGARTAPPHTYIAAYLWSQYGFGADAMLHFGTHGSLEFTPQKQVALGSSDWPDILVGTVPHFYYYTIGNVGESMMAKRRSYATTLSYLTPPFMESNIRNQYRALTERISSYYKAESREDIDRASLGVKKVAVQMGLHRELRLDSVLTVPYTAEEIERIENFAEELASEKMTGKLYITGQPYEADKINSSVMAMSADPIAYSLAAIDRLNGKVTEKQLKNKPFFTANYGDPAKKLVARILAGQPANEALVCSVVGITPDHLAEAKVILTPPLRGMAAMMAAMAAGNGGGGHPAGVPKTGGHPSWIPKTGKRPDTAKPAAKPSMPAMPAAPEYTKEQKERARAIAEAERTILNVANYKTALATSPEAELRSIVNALAGGYVAPTSGGDAVANPSAVPTGRNLYAINAETTPSENAWDKGVSLAEATLEQYKKQHGEYPRKVSYTFWSSEFIESEGATIAQALYMLGVEPVRDPFGRVSDLRLIDSEALGRPRVDVVVQTSGQFRDLAASRLSLITRAVEMAAAAKDDKYDNFVNQSVIETERQLVEQGVSPKAAREMSAMRVFGGLNGMYGTGIQGMVTAGDRWESEKEIAETYIHNMGAAYGSDKNWGEFNAGLLRAVLHNTDVVVQPRQSNTWGALSLDHVYEFMGGMNLAVRDVTGKDPEAYFADYRNRNRVKIQELKESIGVESRTTVFNPEYIREVIKSGASGAAQITETVTNTYGWNVMKPNVIDDTMWDRYYDIYVKDSHNLGVQKFFRDQNPAAMQEITAVMMETARKGMWDASPQQLADIAELHIDLVREFGSSGAGMASANVKLQDFIAQKTTPESAAEYRNQIQRMKKAGATAVDAPTNGMVLKKDEFAAGADVEKSRFNGAWIVSAVLLLFVVLMLVLRKKRQNK